jgi:hypothetical protein
MDENLLKFSFHLDGNIDGVVNTLPVLTNGKAYYLTTDKRLYYVVNNVAYSSPVPKWKILKLRDTGTWLQFNGTDIVSINNPTQLQSNINSISSAVGSLGTAAYQPTTAFAAPSDVTAALNTAKSYTDTSVANVQSQVSSINNSYQTKSYGSTTIPVRLANIVIPEQYGAVGDGVIDDTAAINNAIATGLPVEGLPGKTYAVNGRITYTGSLFRLKNLRFKQLAPQAVDVRTIYYQGSGRVELENLIVDRNGDGTGGALNDSAGIWIAGATSGYIKNCEVFGKDKGNGIAVIDCLNRFLIEGNSVHDLQAGTTTSAVITDDTIQGIWCQRSSVVLRGNTVRNLSNIWTGQVSTRRYTRGIALGGNADYLVEGNYIDGVDQGIDSTGGEVNRRGTYSNNEVNNTYTWGLKFANTGFDHLVKGNRIYRAGCAGIVLSAPTSNIGVDVSFITRRITIIDNDIIDAGIDGNWDNFESIGPCGILILNNPTTYPNDPRGIKMRGNRISAPAGKMRFGIYSRLSPTSILADWNEGVGNDIFDFTVAATNNLASTYAVRKSTTNQPTIANTDLDLVLATIVNDNGGMSADNSNFVVRKSGVYTIQGSARFNSSANGYITMRILVGGTVNNGDTDGEGVVKFPPNANTSESRLYSVSMTKFLSAGTTVRLQVNTGAVASSVVGATLSMVMVPSIG